MHFHSLQIKKKQNNHWSHWSLLDYWIIRDKNTNISRLITYLALMPFILYFILTDLCSITKFVCSPLLSLSHLFLWLLWSSTEGIIASATALIFAFFRRIWWRERGRSDHGTLVQGGGTVAGTGIGGRQRRTSRNSQLKRKVIKRKMIGRKVISEKMASGKDQKEWSRIKIAKHIVIKIFQFLPNYTYSACKKERTEKISMRQKSEIESFFWLRA